jgi:Zn finger protein HypA/HybF involved in hydrogenase expression
LGISLPEFGPFIEEIAKFDVAPGQRRSPEEDKAYVDAFNLFMASNFGEQFPQFQLKPEPNTFKCSNCRTEMPIGKGQKCPKCGAVY